MRFLIVRIAALGDIAMSTTLLNRIRAEYPDAHIGWLCGLQARDFVALLPGLDEVIAIDERAALRGNLAQRAVALLGLWRRLLSKRFDRILMLHPDQRYRLLTWPLWRARMNAASHDSMSGAAANPIRGRYRGDEAARLLDGPDWSGPTYKRYPLSDLRARIGGSSRTAFNGSRIVLVPGGARNVLRENARRRWPVASYRLLAEELLKARYEIVLVGDDHDVPFGREFDGLPVRNMIGKLSLVETLSELRDADVVVTHDTGPMHLARLVRSPIVALFGPTDPREFVGEDESITVIWGGKQLSCRPCYDGRDYPPCSDHVCMRGISVTEVVSAIAQRIGAESRNGLTV